MSDTTTIHGDVPRGQQRAEYEGVDEYTEWEEKPDESEDDADTRGGGGDSTYSPLLVYPGTGYGGGETAGATQDNLLAHGDQSEYARLHSVVRSAIAQELDRERKRDQQLLESAVRVTTNLSGQCLFQRYTVPLNQAIQIVREKPLRGNVIIRNYSATGLVFIGLHEGILVAGPDTIQLVNTGISVSPDRRVVRTKRALWAISSVAACDIDVLEEFD